jgi:hypothetical protein
MANFTDPAYGGAVESSLRNLYEKIILFLPNVVIAAVVLLVGWLLGSFLAKMVRRGLEMAQVDTAGDRIGFDKLSARTGRPFKISRFIQWVIKWFFFLASFIAAADILGLDQVTAFFYDQVLGYAGHVVVAMAILLLGIWAANFFSGIVEGTLRAGDVQSSKTLATLTRWSILIFAIIAALSELQIARDFLQDIFRAVVAMLAIAGGIAFGLGGRDHASRILNKVENDLGKRL